MIRILFPILLLVVSASHVTAQQNRIKLGFIGLSFASGFGMGSIGVERLNKSLSNAWQLSANGSFGEIGNDAGAENRFWGIVEKTFYKKSSYDRFSWSYSFFLEIGTRVKEAGKVNSTPEKTFRETKSFEINPGAALGLQYRLGKRWRLEGVIGPKLIFANGNDYYYNSINRQLFTEPADDIRAGFRLMGLLSYQF